MTENEVIYRLVQQSGLIPEPRLREALQKYKESSARERFDVFLFRSGLLTSAQLMELGRRRDQQQAARSGIARAGSQEGTRSGRYQAESPTASGIQSAGEHSTGGPPPLPKNPGLRNEDHVFAELVVSEGWAPSATMQKALAALAHHRKQGNPHLTLGGILVRKGIINAGQARQLADKLRTRYRACSRCGTRYLPTSHAPGRPYRCPKCDTHQEPGSQNRSRSQPRSGHAEKSQPELDEELEFSSGHPFGPYLIESEIARGGMGIVYKARDRRNNQRLALKIVKSGDEASKEEVERFKRETAAVSLLDHPNIVALYDAGTEDGLLYLAMEYLDGAPLDELIDDDALSLEECLDILVQVVRGVAYAHEQRVIHRDLKPANILLHGDDVPKLTDFGLAKNVEADNKLTKTGTALGTPYYMAPEQFEGTRNVDHRSDIYALGAMMYEMVTGFLPFEGETPVEIYSRIISEQPVPPRERNPSINPDLATICLKALNRHKNRRYQSATDMADDLEACLRGDPISARPPSLFFKAQETFRQRPVLWTLIIVGFLAIPIGSFLGYRAYASHQREMARKHLDDGRTLERDGALARAIEHYRKALRWNGTYVEAWIALGRAHQAKGEPKVALSCLNRAVDLAPGSVPARLQRQKVFRELGQLEDAIEELNKLLALAPEEARFHYERGTCLAELGKQEKALEDYRKAASLDETFAAPRVALARHLVEQDRPGEALPLLEEAIAGNPESIDAHRERARLLMQAEDYKAALKDWNVVLKAESDDALAHRGRGMANYHLGFFEAALADYEAYMANAETGIDEDPTVLTHVGFIHLRDTRAGEALDFFERALLANVDHAPAHFGKAKALLARRDVRGAMTAVDAAVDLDGSNPEYRTLRGKLHLRFQQFEKAITDLDVAIEEGAESAVIYLARGEARMFLAQQLASRRTGSTEQYEKLFSGAKEDLETSLKMEKTFGVVFELTKLTGWPHRQNPAYNPSNSLQFAKQTFSLRPNHFRSFEALSIACAANRDFEKAVNYMQRAIQTTPRSMTNQRSQYQRQLNLYKRLLEKNQ